ncbi:MAG: cysteine desulfurase-like protein [Bacillota bacterium]
MNNLANCRAQFPALDLQVGGRPAAFLDGPGGTQVPRAVLDAITRYLVEMNANAGGQFLTSRRSDGVLMSARQAAADLLGCSSSEVAFGANMTTLVYSLSRAIARDLRPGDEIVVTDLDHHANICPWTALEEQGIIVRKVRFFAPECILDYEDMEKKLSSRTKLIAFGLASNAVGTVNDVSRIVAMARSVGAITVADGVHYVPHFPVNVKAMDVDFLLCSAYKFFGPHVGIVYGKQETFRGLRTYKLRPQHDEVPFRLETGTLNHEGMAGTIAAVDFIAGLSPVPGDQRKRVLGGMEAIEAWERPLASRLIRGLQEMPGVKVYGPPADNLRAPTVSFTVDGIDAVTVAARLGERGFFVWAGDFYACTVVDVLGLRDRGGLVRVGFAPYNTQGEVEDFLIALGEIVT